ncbi:nucleoside hydrolase [Artomyces pyxidatus]|uniref:Nucleoside hydrolase n=1 Tax=Artomyces pyxidatus TaxID=48021 RepID=A0ACB8TJ92_9AGAM|nr:nucleoside hydrolase [Artomyces pyxidatus]
MSLHSVWLDCDPGHDDATAILLALHCRNIHLLGVSTVHGNSDAQSTLLNAARCLQAFAAPESVKVYPGASKPILRSAQHAPEIHGVDGLGGVEGLPPLSDEGVLARIVTSSKAIEAIADALRKTWMDGAGSKISIIASGPLTNVALFLSVYPELSDGIEQIVFMGGGVGVGNRTAVAEFNILCDPEAAQIVLDTPVPKTMVPLNVTHQAIVTPAIQARLVATPTPLRHTLSTLIRFFEDAYKATFGFDDGPPLHDALTVAYVSCPELFKCKRYRVDVELEGKHTVGETIADIWDYRRADDTWGPTGKNSLVALELDVPAFFDLLLDCVAKCDAVSPLNRAKA